MSETAAATDGYTPRLRKKYREEIRAKLKRWEVISADDASAPADGEKTSA
jgi:hypothetical protein